MPFSANVPGSLTTFPVTVALTMVLPSVAATMMPNAF
jgi:hypothetical protein